MGSIHEVIEAFRKAPSNSERGTKFEQLMVRYFELDPMLSQQYDAVWRWIDWPGRDGKADTGIDLVARERDTGDLTAIQCKFYEPTHTLAKADIDSFFTASGKTAFTNRVIISTTDRWGKNAEAALEDQTKPVQRIGMAEIAESPIDWDIAWPAGGDLRIELSPASRHQPRPHQEQAIDAVFRGFAAGNDRGKLIMACGTGKTFTALKIAERTAAENGGAARILFLVPSISLLSQTLRGWTAQTELDLRAFAVCSDTKVSRTAEDYNVHDVPIPVTTDPARLAQEMEHRKRAKGLTVVFSTYQSLAAVAEAQRLGVDTFDLVICDEAHRTTGVTLAGDDESNFVRIHNPDYVQASRRLYMTATPRVFTDAVQDKAATHSAELVSMDDESIYGPEFHRLSFGDAVERGLLSDYKVLVLTIDESVIAPGLQQQVAAHGSELTLDDASKLVGCWNGLAKRAGTAPDGSGFVPGEAPMRRAVAFARDIKTSKQVAEMFPVVVTKYQELLEAHEDDGQQVSPTNRDLTCSVHHVDGTYNALQRNAELTWLKGVVAEDECRILTNARCLSEGVDVPALDAVLFLHPRNSIVDVVQSVGRVMRKADGKDYGYVILPVAVPQGVEPATALGDNQRFKVVWQVLNALRSHDERFDAMVNAIALNSGSDGKGGVGTDKLLGGHLGPVLDDLSDQTDQDADHAQQMALFSLSAWQEAIYARIVDKVGTRTYWEQWAADVADIAAALITRITAVLDEADGAAAEAFGHFLQGLRDNLNDSITEADAVSMLAQHLITRPVFDALFAGHDFASHNPVSKTMQKMVDTLGGTGLEAETARLEGFYESVRRRAGEVSSAEGKQAIIAELYEKFFRIGFKKQAEALGIVYTPTEIVDFILRAVNTVSRKHFGRGLTDEGVHILDGFTGTGTFIARLLQSELITAADLQRKYASELHANEIMLLAYYIAAVNIETTYHALAGKTADTDAYEPFPGVVLADTFQISEAGDSMDAIMFPHNNARIETQLATPINVIVGNPPYSVGQASANDLNANVKYPTLDGRIAATYAKRSSATNKNSLYDSYIRAFRWATDRIGDTGIVGFVSNGGWLDANTADGMRLSLTDEYSAIYVYNLRGNQRTAGELSRREGGKVFGSGSRNTVAIFIGVRDRSGTGPCEVSYRDIGDYLSREEKLRIVSESQHDSLDWQAITPNDHGDWLNQRSDEFPSWPAIGDKSSGARGTVFATYSSGLKTGRDAWCYSCTHASLEANMLELLRQYAEARGVFHTHTGPNRPNEADIAAFLSSNPELTKAGRISWNVGLKQLLAADVPISWRTENVRTSTYRPFNPQWTYMDRSVNDRVYQLPSMFPTAQHSNIGFYAIGVGGTADFALLATDRLPDVQMLGAGQNGQFFPRWTFEKAESDDGGLAFDIVSGEADEHGYRRIDNITDEILTLYRDAVGDQVSKDDIFYYVYGLLHEPAYRHAYAADLKKMLPHIPTPETRERFEQLADAGRRLAKLHVGYETVEPYPLEVLLKPGAHRKDPDTWRVEKMKWRSKTDHSAIIYNSRVTIAGIPEETERYMLGSRSALAWIIDRYQLKTDKASGIVNDPNDWCDEHDDPTYIVDLIKRITTVSIETMKIVDSLAETAG
ncbi:DEAD/DEAH box helicase [Mycolicibacter virginiensis]|uniref:DEAD/DEAH box helicase n=1 Tax=Mycolicibacter virginiensis TaxID=1795032 RepID=UPI001F043B07|nr:DEAD/DEAH box helicase [Mycolicibacter virginiensis]ULP48045.1 DEAD/DEAH box helicase [Mycolicibacter virginiensis]